MTEPDIYAYDHLSNLQLEQAGTTKIELCQLGSTEFTIRQVVVQIMNMT